MDAQTRRAEAATAAIKAASIYDLAKTLANNPTGKQNMVRFPDPYKAEAKGNALARKELGESGRGQGKGVGQKVVGKCTGLSWNRKGNKPTVFLGLLDMTAKKEGETMERDWRTRTLADLLNPERRVEYLEVSDNFGKFVMVPTRGLPVFPECKDEKNLAKNLIECLEIGSLIETFRKKIDYMKKKVEDKTVGIIAKNGSRYHYVKPTGTVHKIVVAKTGESIPSIKRKIHRIRLNVITPEQDFALLYPEWTETATKGKTKGSNVLKSDLELLPLYVAELEQLRKNYEERYENVRPYELGIIERVQNESNGNLPENVEIFRTVFEIEANEDYEYDQPKDVAEKLKTGEYVKREVPKTKGHWVLEPVKEIQTA